VKHEEVILLLKSEVKPALGCTEPAAVALAAARAARLLGGRIDRVEVEVSGNIFKNALAVAIPPTGRPGLKLAAALGALSGEPQKGLSVFDGISDGEVAGAGAFVAAGRIAIAVDRQRNGVYIKARVRGDRGSAEVLVAGGHTNVVSAVLNGSPVPVDRQSNGSGCGVAVDVTGYTFRQFVQAIEEIPLEAVSFLQDGVDMNRRISQKGLELKPGLGVGAALKGLADSGAVADDVVCRARVAVAAACDARMAGLGYPVMSTMGSGNQGLASTLPLVVVAGELDAPRERLLRALALSHLVTAFVKQHTGILSPVCGCAVAAGAGAAAAIAWLMGGGLAAVEGAVKNIIGNTAGMICDGAKGGCSLKLSTAAAEAIISAQLARHGVVIGCTDGIISGSVEDTIRNLGRLSWPGMAGVEEAIVDIMSHKSGQECKGEL